MTSEKITVGSDNYKTFWTEDNVFKIHIDKRDAVHGKSYPQALQQTLERRNVQDPVVLVSGGLDSELAAVVVNLYTQTYRLVHIEYIHEGLVFNTHEQFWAQRLADKLHKPLWKYQLELDSFFGNILERNLYVAPPYLAYAKKYQVRSPQVAAHLCVLDSFSGETVVVGGTLYQGPDSPEAGSDQHGTYRLWHAKGHTGIELLQDSYDLYALSCKLPHSIGRQKDRIAAGKRKAQIFNSFGYDWNFMERPKHTGFELIQQTYAAQGRNWNQLYRVDTLQQLIPEIPTQFV